MKAYQEILRELRENHDLSQPEVAKALGTTHQVYSRYESGKNEMPLRHLVALSRLYRVSTDYILGLEH